MVKSTHTDIKHRKVPWRFFDPIQLTSAGKKVEETTLWSGRLHGVSHLPQSTYFSPEQISHNDEVARHSSSCSVTKSAGTGVIITFQ